MSSNQSFGHGSCPSRDIGFLRDPYHSGRPASARGMRSGTTNTEPLRRTSEVNRIARNLPLEKWETPKLKREGRKAPPTGFTVEKASQEDVSPLPLSLQAVVERYQCPLTQDELAAVHCASPNTRCDALQMAFEGCSPAETIQFLIDRYEERGRMVEKPGTKEPVRHTDPFFKSATGEIFVKQQRPEERRKKKVASPYINSAYDEVYGPMFAVADGYSKEKTHKTKKLSTKHVRLAGTKADAPRNYSDPVVACRLTSSSLARHTESQARLTGRRTDFSQRDTRNRNESGEFLGSAYRESHTFHRISSGLSFASSNLSSVLSASRVSLMQVRKDSEREREKRLRQRRLRNPFRSSDFCQPVTEPEETKEEDLMLDSNPAQRPASPHREQQALPRKHSWGHKNSLSSHQDIKGTTTSTAHEEERAFAYETQLINHPRNKDDAFPFHPVKEIPSKVIAGRSSAESILKKISVSSTSEDSVEPMQTHQAASFANPMTPKRNSKQESTVSLEHVPSLIQNTRMLASSCMDSTQSLPLKSTNTVAAEHYENFTSEGFSGQLYRKSESHQQVAEGIPQWEKQYNAYLSRYHLFTQQPHDTLASSKPKAPISSRSPGEIERKKKERENGLGKTVTQLLEPNYPAPALSRVLYPSEKSSWLAHDTSRELNVTEAKSGSEPRHVLPTFSPSQSPPSYEPPAAQPPFSTAPAAPRETEFFSSSKERDSSPSVQPPPNAIPHFHPVPGSAFTRQESRIDLPMRGKVLSGTDALKTLPSRKRAVLPKGERAHEGVPSSPSTFFPHFQVPIDDKMKEEVEPCSGRSGARSNSRFTRTNTAPPTSSSIRGPPLVQKGGGDVSQPSSRCTSSPQLLSRCSYGAAESGDDDSETARRFIRIDTAPPCAPSPNIGQQKTQGMMFRDGSRQGSTRKGVAPTLQRFRQGLVDQKQQLRRQDSFNSASRRALTQERACGNTEAKKFERLESSTSEANMSRRFQHSRDVGKTGYEAVIGEGVYYDDSVLQALRRSGGKDKYALRANRPREGLQKMDVNTEAARGKFYRTGLQNPFSSFSL